MRTDSWAALFKARGKLIDYIDALWAGRVTASKEHEAIYTQRLAAAAKLASLLRYPRSTDQVRSLIREENATFKRSFLSTDAGRHARSAFNLFARDAASLEDYRLPDGSVATGPETLVGEQLSGVTFSLSFVRLEFDGQSFDILCPVNVRTPEKVIARDEVGFPDQLCAAIGEPVRQVEIGAAALVIVWDRFQVELIFGAGSEDEPLVFTNHDRHRQVFGAE
jgi:hypothetical protein